MVKRILVAGGGGFIGSHLAWELYRKGSFVRIADIKFDGFVQEKYYDEKFQVDLREPFSCQKATEGIDEVYNLAANMGGIGYITSVSAEVMHDNTLINTFLLEASVINKIKGMFFSSSACIYPVYKQNKPDIQGLRETDAYPADPNEGYGWEKLFMERMIQAYQKDYGLNIRIARFHNIYGPEGTYKGGREKAPAALCRKVAEANSPGTIEIWGDGKATRSFCYVDDCIRGILLLMESDYDQPINIGSDRQISIDCMADIIIKISGKKITKAYDMQAPEGVRGRNANIALAREKLGWEPTTDLEQGLQRTYQWVSHIIGQETEPGAKNLP
jgi:GDP-D-mannose 3', 5'-epimerase